MPSAIERFQKNAPQIIANKEEVQAIFKEDLVQAVFWEPGKLDLPDGTQLSINRPGMIQLRMDNTTKKWSLSAGNPTHEKGLMLVKVQMKGKETTELKFEFPEGPFAGKPQTQELP
jgi:hypothetical protein